MNRYMFEGVPAEGSLKFPMNEESKFEQPNPFANLPPPPPLRMLATTMARTPPEGPVTSRQGERVLDRDEKAQISYQTLRTRC